LAGGHVVENLVGDGFGSQNQTAGIIAVFPLIVAITAPLIIVASRIAVRLSKITTLTRRLTIKNLVFFDLWLYFSLILLNMASRFLFKISILSSLLYNDFLNFTFRHFSPLVHIKNTFKFYAY
jgi:hypothetical protein